MAKQKNEALLIKYLERKEDIEIQKRSEPGRPRKHPAGSQRTVEGEQKYSFVSKIEYVKSMKTIAKKKNISIKQVFCEALEDYIKKYSE